jgi:hypothetical protein
MGIAPGASAAEHGCGHATAIPVTSAARHATRVIVVTSVPFSKSRPSLRVLLLGIFIGVLPFAV